MIDAQPRTETSSSEGERQPDQVIGINKIVGRRAEIKLRKDAADHIQLNTFVCGRSAPPDQAKTIAEPDRRNRRVSSVRIIERAKLAALEADKGPRFLGIRDCRAEDLVVRKHHDPQRLLLVDTCSA